LRHQAPKALGDPTLSSQIQIVRNSLTECLKIC
jgi:hypothetical protein